MGLKRKSFDGIKYNSLGKFTLLGLNALTSIVLARHLVAEDYGIVSFAAIFINFLAQFSDFGLMSATVRKKDLPHEELCVAYTLVLCLSLVAFGIAVVVAPISQYFIDNVDVVKVIRISSLSFMILTFSFLPLCILTRELNFKKLVIPQVASTVVTSAVSITMALSGYKYWSLVFGSLCGSVALVVVLNLVHPIRPRIMFDKHTAYNFLKLGGNLFLSGLVVFVLFNADNFAIGVLGGASILGFYALAFNWGSMIASILHSTVHSVLFPVFSRVQDREDSLIGAYLQVLRYVSFLAVLVNMGLFLLADDFLYFVLGRNSDKWIPAVAALKILCSYGIIRAVLEPISNVLVAVGQTQLLFRANLMVSVVQLVLLYPIMRLFGIEGVAILVTLCYGLQFFIYFPYMKEKYNLPYKAIWQSFQPAFITGIVVVVLMTVLVRYLENSIIMFVSKILLISAMYVLVYGLITKWRMVTEVKAIVLGNRAG